MLSFIPNSVILPAPAKPLISFLYLFLFHLLLLFSIQPCQRLVSTHLLVSVWCFMLVFSIFSCNSYNIFYHAVFCGCHCTCHPWIITLLFSFRTCFVSVLVWQNISRKQFFSLPSFLSLRMHACMCARMYLCMYEFVYYIYFFNVNVKWSETKRKFVWNILKCLFHKGYTLTILTAVI